MPHARPFSLADRTFQSVLDEGRQRLIEQYFGPSQFIILSKLPIEARLRI